MYGSPKKSPNGAKSVKLVTLLTIILNVQDNVRRRLDQKTQDLLQHDREALHEQLPSNVEPGFEAEYRQRADHGQTMQQLRKRSVVIIEIVVNISILHDHLIKKITHRTIFDDLTSNSYFAQVIEFDELLPTCWLGMGGSKNVAPDRG